MTFLEFCRLHGIVLTREPAPGRWVRVPTEDKPKHRNGAVKFMGTVGFAQNWATMTEAATWHADGTSTEATKRVQQIANQAAAEDRVNAQKAAKRAEAMLGDCELAQHPYLAAKGFPDELANVWNRETDNVLLIPMRRAGALVGVQCIKPDGDKKFLYGQRSGGAEFVMGTKGTHVLCEGYATGLSVQQALRNLKVPYVLHVCFSAANVTRAAEQLPVGIVIADNDAPSKQAPNYGGMGKKVADESGWPYWISDTTKEDANDFAQRRGVFALAMGIKGVLQVRRRA